MLYPISLFIVVSCLMVLSLIDKAKLHKDIKMQMSLWNTYYCQSKIYGSNGRLYGQYCKNRFCTVCCGIRKAEIINKYLPVIKTWQTPYFVTLTIKAVPAHRLKSTIVRGMLRGFNRILTKYKKRHQRGNSIKLLGLRALECNFNPIKQWYNPHFHIIVPDKETAEILVNEWLKLWTPKFANRLAQDSQPIKNREKALIEIIKYGSKIFTEPDLSKKADRKIPPTIYTAALYNILVAMKDHRIFERFGFNLPELVNKRNSEAKTVTDYEIWKHEAKLSDWVNPENQKLLTGYIAPQDLISLLRNNIDFQLE